MHMVHMDRKRLINAVPIAIIIMIILASTVMYFMFKRAQSVPSAMAPLLDDGFSATPGGAEKTAYLTALIRKADTIVVGRVVSGGPGKPQEIKELLALHNFNVMFPTPAQPMVCIEVSEVLRGEASRDGKKCFYRLSEFTIAFPKGSWPGGYPQGSGIWFLSRSQKTGLLWISDPAAFQPLSMLCSLRPLIATSDKTMKRLPPEVCDPREAGLSIFPSIKEMTRLVDELGEDAIPFLRFVLQKGPPPVQHNVVIMFSRYGLLPLIPDIIELIPVSEQLPREGDVILGSLGSNAAGHLLQVASALEGDDFKKRKEEYRLTDYPLEDFETRAKAIQSNWQKWWKEYTVK